MKSGIYYHFSEFVDYNFLKILKKKLMKKNICVVNFDMHDVKPFLEYFDLGNTYFIRDYNGLIKYCERLNYEKNSDKNLKDTIFLFLKPENHFKCRENLNEVLYIFSSFMKFSGICGIYICDRKKRLKYEDIFRTYSDIIIKPIYSSEKIIKINCLNLYKSNKYTINIK